MIIPPDRYFATTAWGAEVSTEQELRAIGAREIDTTPGGVWFSGDISTLYRAHLWLRTPQRILKPIREFDAKTAEILYSQTRRIRWEDWLTLEKTFSVHATLDGIPKKTEGGNPGIRNSMFAALKIKDALCDRLRQEIGGRPNVDTESPDLRIHAHFSKGKCLICLDASGDSLHQRAYRTTNHVAPLKETLAATIIKTAGWTPEFPLVDPFCGSGTLLIEAAMLAWNIAPGLLRDRFAFQKWPDYDPELWEEERKKAQTGETKNPSVTIIGTDQDRASIEAAKKNADRAGVSEAISFRAGKLSESKPPPDRPPGFIITNPPYGTRLGTESELTPLYRNMGEHWTKHFPGWRAFVLAGNLKLAREIPLIAHARHKLFNGGIECRLLEFQL